MSAVREGPHDGLADLDVRSTVGTAALMTGFALLSLLCWYVLTPVVADAGGPVVLTVAVMASAVVPRLLIGVLVARDAARRGPGGAGVVLSCLLGAALGALVLPGSLSVYGILAVPGTSLTWVTLGANIAFSALNVAAGAALVVRRRRRR